jgi:hypothetical protein
MRRPALLFCALACTDAEPDKAEPASCASRAEALPYTPGLFTELDGKVGGREGDVLLQNAAVRLVIQGPGRNLAVNPYGGNLIDADVARAGPAMRDAFGELGLFLNLAGTSAADTVELIPPDPAAGRCEASVIVRGGYALADYINPTTGIALLFPGLSAVDLDAPHPLQIELTYTLRPDASHVELDLQLTNVGDQPTPALVSWLVDAGLVDPFLQKSNGFDVGTIASGELLALEGRDQAYVFLPLTEPRVPGRGLIGLVGAYGVGHTASLPDLLGFPDSAPWLEPGASLSARAAFIVAPDLATALPIAWELLGEPACEPVRGVVREQGSELPIAGVEVTASTAPESGSPVDLANTTTDVEGAFSFCLPPGPVALIAGQEGRPYAGGAEVPPELRVTAPDEAVSLLLPPTGALRGTVTDGDGGPLPCRLTVVGLDPSPPSPRLGGDGFDPLAPGIAAVVDSLTGDFDLRLEPGDYTLWVSRGPEYDVVVSQVTVQPDQVATFSGALHRVLDTTGFLSGDFHVHAQASTDATVRDEARVRNMLAEGVEILVATDHAYVTDYQPIIEALGQSSRITSVPGQEITTFDYGHYAGFPLPVDVTVANQGAIDWTGQSPDDILALAGVPEQRAVVQLNHPRAIPAPGTLADYFTTLDLQFDATGPFVGANAIDPLTVRLDANDRLLSTGFVAMEVMTWVNVQGLSDWFNFLNAGVRFTATGNSDTHTTRVESSGWPRNFVLLDHDDPATVDPQQLVDALYDGRSTVSFGALADLRATGLGSARLGGTLRPDAQGQLTLTATVQAAAWAPFDRVELIDGASGEVVAVLSGTPAAEPFGGGERLLATLSEVVKPASDTWYAVRVTGSAGLFPVVPIHHTPREALTAEVLAARSMEGQATVFALSNPVFVDVDGDGEITPSHLVLPEDHEDWRREDRTAPY